MIDISELVRMTEESEMFRMLDMKIETAEVGRVVISMPVTSRVHQYIGIMNGGFSLLLAETAASFGAVIGSDLTKVSPVGIEINANHLRAVSKGTITAEAKNVYHGRSISVWQVEINDSRGKLVCVSRCTLSLKPGAAQVTLPKSDA